MVEFAAFLFIVTVLLYIISFVIVLCTTPRNRW